MFPGASIVVAFDYPLDVFAFEDVGVLVDGGEFSAFDVDFDDDVVPMRVPEGVF